jgi:CheY-like chemotaxis protein
MTGTDLDKPCSEPPPAKVLVVEDVALIRMATMDMVEEIGFAACEAADGPEALDLLRRDGAITILMADLGLPGMSGQELVAEALRLKPDLKVVIATGHSAGPADNPQISYLQKPFNLAQLRKALKG